MKKESPALLDAIAILLEQSKYQEAIIIYDSIIEKEPSNANYYFFRGIAKESLHKYEEAKADASITIKLNPNYKIAYYFRALINFKQANYLESLEDCGNILNIDTNDFDAYYLRARCKAENQEYSAAIEDCNKARDLNPNSASLSLLIGIIKFKLNSFLEAIKEFNITISIEPNYSDAFYYRSFCYSKLHDYDQAIKDCHNAVKIDGTFHLAFGLLGHLYYEGFRNIEKAICAYRIASDLFPEHSDYLYQVANMYSKWNIKNAIEESFFDSLGQHSIKCKTYYIDELSYKERLPISIGYFSRFFVNMASVIRTDLTDLNEHITVVQFIGNSEYLLSPLIDKLFYFSDIRCFPDKISDCPLLSPLNHAHIAVQLTYDHVRVRSLCYYKTVNELEQCLSLWDRYANGHSGIAYQYKIKKEWIIRNNIYSNKITYHDKEIILNGESPEDIIENGLFTKNVGYIDENEWRLALFGKFEGKEGVKVSWKCDDSNYGVEIESIFLGLYLHIETKELIKELAKKENIQVYDMIRTIGGLKALKS